MEATHSRHSQMVYEGFLVCHFDEIFPRCDWEKGRYPATQSFQHREIGKAPIYGSKYLVRITGAPSPQFEQR